MTEHVFLVWGRNQQLAIEVAKELAQEGYFPTVGGMQRGASANSFFINTNVIQQMENASVAIILVQRIYDAAGNPTAEFRPNLMFEWGYLQRRLRADAIHVFLINISRSELPSDLLNAYSHEVKTANPSNISTFDIKKAANEIFNLFIGDVASIDLDGLEIIQKYDAHRVALSEIATGRRAFNSKEVGYTLLHMTQPAFYRNDLIFIKECIRDFSNKSIAHFADLIVLLDQIIRYYEITDSTKSATWRVGSAKSTAEYRGFEKIASTLQSVAGSQNKIYNIFDVILNNFLGLAYFRMFDLTGDAGNLRNSIAALERARIECEAFKSVHPANEGFVRKLWKSYIERNLSRVYFLDGNHINADHFGKSAEMARLMVSSQLSAVGATGISKQFELEIGLSNLDRIMQSGSKESDLAELVEKYIEPNNPRGVDRVWERLHSAVLKEANAKGYNRLANRLKKLRSTP